MFKNTKLDLFGKLFLGGMTLKVADVALQQAKMRKDLEKPGATEILAQALESSVVWKDEISKPGATPENVVEKLGLLNTTIDGFEKITGVSWPF